MRATDWEIILITLISDKDLVSEYTQVLTTK